MPYCGAWVGNNNPEVGMYFQAPDFDANLGQNWVFWLITHTIPTFSVFFLPISRREYVYNPLQINGL